MKPARRKKPQIDVYKAEDGWRWRVRANNGRVLADGGEAYRRRSACVRGIEAASDILVFADYDALRAAK